MSKKLYTHDELPAQCEPIEVDEDGRTTKLVYGDFIFAKGWGDFPLWKISRADGKPIPEALGGLFTSIDQCIRAVGSGVLASTH